DREAARVQHRARRIRGEITEGRDAVAADGHVQPPGRRARAVVDQAALDEHVEGAGGQERDQGEPEHGRHASTRLRTDPSARAPALPANRRDYNRPVSNTWQLQREEHQREVASFLAVVEGLDDETWAKEPAPGKWSPGQITEHLVLTYAALRRE